MKFKKQLINVLVIVFNRYTRDHAPLYLSNEDDKQAMKALRTSVYALQASVYALQARVYALQASVYALQARVYFRVCVSAGV